MRQGINIKAVLESDNLQACEALTTDREHISLGLCLNSMDEASLACARLSERDVASGFLFAGYLRGRALPVASARFLEQLVAGLSEVSEG